MLRDVKFSTARDSDGESLKAASKYSRLLVVNLESASKCSSLDIAPHL